MTVLYTITAYLPSVGGAQYHLHEFARQVQRREAVQVVYQWDTNRSDWLLGTTLNAPLGGGPFIHDEVSAFRLSLTDEQRAALRPYVYAYRLLQGVAIEQISRRLMKNLRAMLQDSAFRPSVVHNFRVGREGLTAASLALDVPFVFTTNHHHHWHGWLYRHYCQMMQQADYVIAHTEFERQALIGMGVKPDHIQVIGVAPLVAPNADGARFRLRYDIPADAPLVLFLGQKYAYKRFDYLLRAADAIWRDFPTARLVFIGPRKPMSDAVFAKLKDPRIVELDTVDLQTKSDALAACDLLCMPSARESFGMVYLEAWHYGKPIIAGSAPAVREIVQHGVNGYRASSVAEVAAYTRRLLSSAGLRAEFGAAGRAYGQQFQWESLAAKLTAVYDAVRG
jgi:glycosyltransferase involved in cell wall biosynthesis